MTDDALPPRSWMVAKLPPGAKWTHRASSPPFWAGRLRGSEGPSLPCVVCRTQESVELTLGITEGVHLTWALSPDGADRLGELVADYSEAPGAIYTPIALTGAPGVYAEVRHDNDPLMPAPCVVLGLQPEHHSMGRAVWRLSLRSARDLARALREMAATMPPAPTLPAECYAPVWLYSPEAEAIQRGEDPRQVRAAGYLHQTAEEALQSHVDSLRHSPCEFQVLLSRYRVLEEVDANGAHRLRHLQAVGAYQVDGNGWAPLPFTIPPVDLVAALDLGEPFASLARPGLDQQGFTLWVAGPDGYLAEWNGEPLSEVVRVECWFWSGRQYVYTVRDLGGPWLTVELGEASDVGLADLTLEALAATLPPEAVLADVHPALHPFLREADHG